MLQVNGINYLSLISHFILLTICPEIPIIKLKAVPKTFSKKELDFFEAFRKRFRQMAFPIVFFYDRPKTFSVIAQKINRID